MTGSTRSEIPSHNHPFQRFMAIVDVTAEQFGVAESISVTNCLNELRAAVEKHVVETSSGVEKQQRLLEMEKRKFIAVFKARYLQFTDLEFTRMITPTDGRLIKQTVKHLNERGFTADDYLKWCFETFYPENQKFCPPSIKQACSSFILERFWFEHADVIKSKRESEKRKKIALDYISRGRVLIRSKPDDAEWKEKIKKILKDFKEGRIMLDEMVRKIKELEVVLQHEQGVMNKA